MVNRNRKGNQVKPKPKFKVGDRVANLRGETGRIDGVWWSYAYHLKGEPDSTVYQPDEIKRKVKEKRHGKAR